MSLEPSVPTTLSVLIWDSEYGKELLSFKVSFFLYVLYILANILIWGYSCSAPILFFCRIFEFLKCMDRALGISFSLLDVVLFEVSAFSSLLIFVEPVFENV